MDLSSVIGLNSVVGKNQLKSGIINSGEVATSRWLVFFRTKSEGVKVDTSVWVTAVVLEWLNNIEVDFALCFQYKYILMSA